MSEEPRARTFDERRERHRLATWPSIGPYQYCDACATQWPCDAAVAFSALAGEDRAVLAERMVRRKVAAERDAYRQALERIIAMREHHPEVGHSWPPDNNWEMAADDMAQIAYQALAGET